jgi:hypothetical protein
MKARAIFPLFVIALTSLVACGSRGDEPEDVARQFWSAMEARDIEKARSCATEETAGSLTINEEAGDEDVEIVFGDVTFEDGRAQVKTTMVTSHEGTEIKIPMQTVLVEENGAWKVDVDQTMMSLFGGAMGAMMQGMGEAMQKGMEDMGNAMTDAMEGAMDEMEQSLQSDGDD